jgi:hypothetical protein
MKLRIAFRSHDGHGAVFASLGVRFPDSCPTAVRPFPQRNVVADLRYPREEALTVTGGSDELRWMYNRSWQRAKTEQERKCKKSKESPIVSSSELALQC